MTQLSYAAAGVSIDAGDELVERIKPAAKRTMIPGVLGSIGGFGALFEVSKDYKNPVLVTGTDGVGTKLMLAFKLGRHDTVGQDLVAMSVNDILVQGAKSLFFLDYYACGKLDVDVASRVVAGVAKGCELAGCALIGGETAEMKRTASSTAPASSRATSFLALPRAARTQTASHSSARSLKFQAPTGRCPLTAQPSPTAPWNRRESMSSRCSKS